MSVSTNKLKHLQRRLEGAINDVNTKKDERKILSEQILKGESQIAKMRKEIEDLKNEENGIIVSEHAILRYFERVLGFNIEDVKKQILPDDVHHKIKLLGGSGSYPVDNYRIKVKDGVIVTILTEEESK